MFMPCRRGKERNSDGLRVLFGIPQWGIALRVSSPRLFKDATWWVSIPSPGNRPLGRAVIAGASAPRTLGSQSPQRGIALSGVVVSGRDAGIYWSESQSPQRGIALSGRQWDATYARELAGSQSPQRGIALSGSNIGGPMVGPPGAVSIPSTRNRPPRAFG